LARLGSFARPESTRLHACYSLARSRKNRLGTHRRRNIYFCWGRCVEERRTNLESSCGCSCITIGQKIQIPQVILETRSLIRLPSIKITNRFALASAIIAYRLFSTMSCSPNPNEATSLEATSDRLRLLELANPTQHRIVSTVCLFRGDSALCCRHDKLLTLSLQCTLTRLDMVSLICLVLLQQSHR
jgi:hypothetical protein